LEEQGQHYFNMPSHTDREKEQIRRQKERIMQIKRVRKVFTLVLILPNIINIYL
jgi:hypothetical protein